MHSSSLNSRKKSAAVPRIEAPIWASRPVEWPFTKIPLPMLAKLLRNSRVAGQHLGLIYHDTTAASTTPGTEDQADSASPAKAPGATTQAADGSYFSGLMSRVLNTSGGGTNSASADDWLDAEQAISGKSNSFQTLRPPRCVAVANGWIVAIHEVSLPNNALLRFLSRWNVRRGVTSIDWVALPPPATPNAKIKHVFSDPTASHVFISAENGEAYYSSNRNTLTKLNGFGNADTKVVGNAQVGLTPNSYVTSIAWDKERGTEGSTKTILLGTNLGEIYEYSMTESTTSPGPTLLRQLGSTNSITGLSFERLRTGLVVLVSTRTGSQRTRLYSYVAQHSSSNFRFVVQDANQQVQELPGTEDVAELILMHDHFALQTQFGIYYGSIDRNLPATVSANVLVDAGLLRWEEILDSSPVASLALTPHHIIVLTEANEVRFISWITQKLIQKEVIEFHADDTLCTAEFLMDIRRPDQIWLRKGRSLVHISSTQEDRDVWKFTLQKCLSKMSQAGNVPEIGAPLTDEEKAQEALFDQAKTMCTVASQKAVVAAVRAEYHLRQGRGELAAKYLAQCPSILEPFADNAVRLALPKLGIDDPKSYGGSWKARACLESSNLPLIAYLNDKMRIASAQDDKMVCTMIGAWLTELFLHESTDLLAQFLNANVNTMDAKTVMEILTSHDAKASACTAYASASGDIATAVNAALDSNSADPVRRSLSRVNNSLACLSLKHVAAFGALRILNDAGFEQAEHVYYKHASLLLARAPAAAGESFLLRYQDGLSPSRLLPAIMKYESIRSARRRAQVEQAKLEASGEGAEEAKFDSRYSIGGPNESSDGFEIKFEAGLNVASFVDDSTVAIKYLEGVISQGCRHGSVFRYLLSLYIGMEDEEPLYEFLSAHVSGSTSVIDATKKALLRGDNVDHYSSTPLDISYALRAVLKSGRHFRSAIKLYMGFGMRQQAVELALKVDPSLARNLAQGSIEPEERKRLWLMIAKASATDGSRGGKDVVSRVVAVLKDCGPDVLSIEDVLPFLPDFAQIDQIKDEICEALTSYSSKIDGFLREMSDCDQLCETVRQEIFRLKNHQMKLKTDARCALTNQRIVSAGEPFYVFPSGYVFLASALRNYVLPLLDDEQRARVAELSTQIAGHGGDISKIQSELDGILATDCPFTGSRMVDSIDKGFDVDEDEGLHGLESADIDRVDV